MRRVPAGLAGLALATGLATVVALPASGSPPDGNKRAAAKPSAIVDDLSNPAEEKRRELRKAAIQKVIDGTAKVEQRGASKVVKVGQTTTARKNGKAAAPTYDQYVELGREKTDKIFVILAEFGNERDPNYPDQDTAPATPGPTRFDGPLHNQIDKPDRTKNNSRRSWRMSRVRCVRAPRRYSSSRERRRRRHGKRSNRSSGPVQAASGPGSSRRSPKPARRGRSIPEPQGRCS